MKWRASIAAAVALLAAACSGASHHAAAGRAHAGSAPRQELFGFDTYYTADESGLTRVVRLDPVTLREQPFGSLRLGDSVTGHVLSPDRTSLAFGGENDGEVIVADLVRYDVASRVNVVANPQPSDGPRISVFVAAWPRADRLLGYAEPIAAHVTYPARFVLVDLVTHRVSRSAPLGGWVVATAALGDGRAVFLVEPVGALGPARLVIADAEGRLRSTMLANTVPAGVPAARGDQDVEPGLAVVGDHIYVVGESDRIADIDASSGRLAYHRVRGLLSQQILDGPPVDPGSGGVMWMDSRTVGDAGDGLLYVAGGGVRPARHETQNQEFTLSAQLVDATSWTVRRTLRNATQVAAAHGLYYCWIGDDKFAGNTETFVALRPDGAVAFRRTIPNGTWQISACRLFETTYVGDREVDVELDPLTGRVLRQVASLSSYALDLVSWTRP